jgi:hypothetical protein
MINKYFPRILWLSILLAFPCLLQAELVFDKESLFLNAKINDKKTIGLFKFTNRGKSPVKIIKVKSSCGCTTAELKKKEYQVGESGQIEVTFLHEKRQGMQEKKITVYTNDPKNSKHILTLKVNIPLILKVSPRILYWRKEDRLQKNLTVDVMYEDPIHISSVHCTNPNFEVEIKEIKVGRQYAILVTPSKDAQLQQGTLIIQTDLPQDINRTFQTYLRIFE